MLHNRLQQQQDRIGNDRRHFHQLFYQLRITQNRAHRDVRSKDLGHISNPLGNGREPVEELEHVLQLFHRLRHRRVENLHHGRKADEIDNVLHGVPLNPFLRPGLCENPGPHPCGVFVKQLEEHRVPDCFGPLSPWSLPGPVRLLCCCCFRRVLSQCVYPHCDTCTTAASH